MQISLPLGKPVQHCNAEMVSLRLRVGPVRRISNVLGVKLKLQEFFRYEKMDCPVSVITLCFKKRLPRLEAVSYVSLGLGPP